MERKSLTIDFMLVLVVVSLLILPGTARVLALEYGGGGPEVHMPPVTIQGIGTVDNGDFELGNLSSWGIYHAGNTTGWSAYSGTTSPESGLTIAAPPQGTWAATSHQVGWNVQVLYQDITLNGFYELNFIWYSKNWAGVYYTPDSLCWDCGFANQHYRADIMNPAADLLSVAPADIYLNIFKTMPGDPMSIPPTPVNVDLSPWAGQTVRLRFAEVDNQWFYNGSVDDIWLDLILIEVNIDIKPGSCPNPFNDKSKGSIPVAIIGTADLDVTTIDPESITLAGVPALADWEIKDSTQPDGDDTDCYTCFDATNPANFNCDLDPLIPGNDAYCGDGYPDLIVKFDTQALGAAIASLYPEAGRDDCVTLELNGETLAGVPIVGSDSMVIKSK